MTFKLILWSLIIYGVTQIITESTLFKPLRDALGKTKYTMFLKRLMACFLCTSVWVSALAAWYVYSPSASSWNYLMAPVFFDIPFSETMIEYTRFKIIFIDAMIGSSIVWFLHCFEEKLLK